MRPEPIANSRTGPDPARRARQRDGRLDDLRREHLGGFLVVDGGGLLIPDTTADHAHRLPGRQPRCDAGTSRSPVSDTTPAPRSDSAIRPRRDDPNRGPPLCHSPEMDDVATGPRARSEGRAAGLASLVGVLVDLAFLGVYAAATAMIWATTPTCTTVTLGRWSAGVLIPILVPLLGVGAALLLCTLAARPHPGSGFWIWVIAAVLPAWFLIPALTSWAFGSWPQTGRSWCF